MQWIQNAYKIYKMDKGILPKLILEYNTEHKETIRNKIVTMDGIIKYLMDSEQFQMKPIPEHDGNFAVDLNGKLCLIQIEKPFVFRY